MDKARAFYKAYTGQMDNIKTVQSVRLQLLFVVSQSSSTLVITFDDVPNSSLNYTISIPNGYKNLNWTNGLVLNTTARPDYRLTGFYTALKSGQFVGYNVDHKPLTIHSSATGQTFNVSSFTIAATLVNNTQLTIVGQRSCELLYTQTLLLKVRPPATVIVLNWINLDSLILTVTNGSQFAMDDLSVSVSSAAIIT
ncbi:unnamed protein product, partial [Didymodactylos carnosus]